MIENTYHESIEATIESATPKPTSTPVPTATPKPTGKLFDDVQNPSHPYYQAIYWAVDEGITKGYTGTNLFGIDDPCTRRSIRSAALAWIFSLPTG